MGWNGSFEDLYSYFQKKVRVEQDSATSIMTLSVKAYSAKDAQNINLRMLEQSEELVNRLNQRGRKDLIQYAETEVVEAQADATRAAMALAEYRNRTGVIDPERQATIQLQMISKLQDELIGARNQLYQLESTVPNNPQIRPLKLRIENLNHEINHKMSSVAGSNGSLSAAATRYQRLALERELADRRLGSALSSLQDARNDARRKQAYVERIVQPNLPDEALEPRRIRSIFAALVLALITWGVVTMLLAGVREHQN
jgi:BexC/CtrB/KpsE family polysaccharide export inner-membrane protein